MKKEVITYRLPKNHISEVFRTLRTNIQFINTKKGLHTLMVTSTTPSEGKSWVTANLAVTFAQAGKKVVLVDCDLRKGRQFSIFGVPPTPGFSNYLSGIDSSGNEGSNDILQYIRDTEVENLFLIPSGNVPPNPSELLGSDQMQIVIKKLEEHFDLVIFDTTPSVLVTDAIIISRYVDTSIIVASYKTAKIEDLQRIKREIQNVGGKIAGVVLNKVPITQKTYKGAYYYGSNELVKVSNTKKSSALTRRKEEELRAEYDRKNIKAKTNEIIKQNRENMSTQKHLNSNSNNNYINKNNVPVQNSEELLKKLNNYINEEKSKIKGDKQ